MIELNKIYEGEAGEVLKTFPDQVAHCCVSSPPYWALRNYGHEDQIGMEPTPAEYISKMVAVFSQVKRILKDDGTLWLNISDTYFGGKGNNGASIAYSEKNGAINQKALLGTIPGVARPNDLPIPGLKPKDLVGIPWMLAFALRDDGWYWRDTIIWHKPNPMPESVLDRCTKSHEYILMFSKSKTYFYDQVAIKTPVKDSTVQRMLQQVEEQKGSDRVPGKTNGRTKAVGSGRIPRKGIDNKSGNQGSVKGIPAMAIHGHGVAGHSGNFDINGNLIGDGMANKKSVWTVNTKGFPGSHFATYPEELIVDCIKAGSPRGGGGNYRPFHGIRDYSCGGEEIRP